MILVIPRWLVFLAKCIIVGIKVRVIVFFVVSFGKHVIVVISHDSACLFNTSPVTFVKIIIWIEMIKRWPINYRVSLDYQITHAYWRIIYLLKHLQVSDQHLKHYTQRCNVTNRYPLLDLNRTLKPDDVTGEPVAGIQSRIIGFCNLITCYCESNELNPTLNMVAETALRTLVTEFTNRVQHRVEYQIWGASSLPKKLSLLS